MSDRLESIQPMEGQGAYNRSSRVQAAGLTPAIALLEQAAKVVPLGSSREPVFVVDYGSSEGRNSMAPMAKAIGALRPRLGPERAINVVHTDVAGNDFGALFAMLADATESYLKTNRAVFAFAVGRSYFEQVMPQSSVTLGWSSWAIQWLSRTPAFIPDQVQVAYSRDAAARDAYRRQAAEDWQIFLAQRSRELVPGGRIVIVTMATDDLGSFGYAPLLDAMYSALKDLAADGFMREDELHRMVIPTVARNRVDFEAPFARSGQFEGLSLIDLEVFPGEDRVWSDFEKSRDADAFGAAWARFSRGSVFPTLADALEGADASRQVQFFDRLEMGIASRLAKAPVGMQIPLAKMIVAKELG
jgi:SAM dependent carboxyl methyltransferase